MKDYIGYGPLFWAAKEEFWTGQVEELLEDCRKLIADARARNTEDFQKGRIPVPLMDGYQFVLLLIDEEERLWKLELDAFPPHDDGGGRIRSARRKREKQERKQAQQEAMAARPKKQPRITDAARPKKKNKKSEGDKRAALFEMFCKALRSEFRHKILTASAAMESIGHNVRAHLRRVIARARVRLREVEIVSQSMLYRTCHYAAQFDVFPSREKRNETTCDLASGMRLESRLYTIGRLQIHLNTWAPIDPGFDQIWDTSLFGVRLLESENL
ncbi:MAG: hypothetical protein QM759_11185 [Terricaulis sp.]